MCGGEGAGVEAAVGGFHFCMFAFPTRTFRIKKRSSLPHYGERRALDGILIECSSKMPIAAKTLSLAMATRALARHGACCLICSRAMAVPPRWRSTGAGRLRFDSGWSPSLSRGSPPLRGRTEGAVVPLRTPTWKLSRATNRVTLSQFRASGLARRPGKNSRHAPFGFRLTVSNLYSMRSTLHVPWQAIQNVTLPNDPIAGSIEVLVDELKGQIQKPLPAADLLLPKA